MQHCPSCATANPEGFRLCGMCGTPLVGEAEPSRAERKIVSVLFCDLAGFTARSEQLDPEDVRALLAPYHARVRTELERHGGTVEKFIGDAVWSLPFHFLLSRVSAQFEPQLQATLEAGPPWPWKDLALATLDGDFVRAAEMWAAAGGPTSEARLRMRAAEELIAAGRRQDGEVELRKALAFYREVGATFWIERGEALLAKSA